ncbi:MAG: hypothetical protein ACLP1X_20465 [Polyangiaceae bacterium]
MDRRGGRAGGGPSLICNSTDACQPYGSVGSACSTNNDCCTTNACIGGTCADTSVCANPGDAG